MTDAEIMQAWPGLLAWFRDHYESLPSTPYRLGPHLMVSDPERCHASYRAAAERATNIHGRRQVSWFIRQLKAFVEAS